MINKELKKSNFNTICVKCSSNNTIISLVNPEGSIITTLSSGHLKYKGSRKGTQTASQQVIYCFGEKILELGYDCFIVKIKGIGKGRSSVIKELKIPNNIQCLTTIFATVIIDEFLSYSDIFCICSICNL